MTNKSTPTPTVDDVANAFQALYEALQDAYWDATDIQGKDRITGVTHVVSDILTDLEQEGIERDNATFKSIQKEISSIQGRLDQLKTDIDSIIHNVATATKVASAIDQALSYAVKFGLLA